ncbi:farnesyl pyrophosphate synthase [Huso huso]|uniref:Farnesyl pyrophosphate synthase n=1 Tax=Huso huso TaxID=61971 RepID=A0ABR0YFC0_HUSHU
MRSHQHHLRSTLPKISSPIGCRSQGPSSFDGSVQSESLMSYEDPGTTPPKSEEEAERGAQGELSNASRKQREDMGDLADSADRKQQGALDAREFDRQFEEIVKELTEPDLNHPEIGDAIRRLREVLEYNAPGGKRNRGLSVIASFRELSRPQTPDAESVQRALVVGWCIELLQAFFLVADDIMDASVTRRGQPCWYKRGGVGLDAINDSFLLEAVIYRLLKRYCRAQPCYLNLIELFLETSYQTELGQALDLMTAQPDRIDLTRFTEER